MIPRARRVWVTRAEPGAGETAARLATLGVEAHVAPLLHVEPTPAQIDLSDIGALAFTSRNGVDAFVRRHGPIDLRVYAVGDATAAQARTLGFTDVISADGDGATLAQRIRTDAPPGAVLHPGPVEPAGDLVGALTAGGVTARFVAIYRTVEAATLTAATADALTRGALTDILVHSPRAAGALARLLPPDRSAGMSLWGLSQACLTPLGAHPFAGCTAAPRPREDALIETLTAALGISAAHR